MQCVGFLVKDFVKTTVPFSISPALCTQHQEHGTTITLMPKRFIPFLTALLFAAALLVRLVDLTDQPLDFNPSRQLFSAIIARAIYYEGLPGANPEMLELARSHRAELEKLEPPILESIVVAGYRLTGGENLWIARLVSITTWMAGGVLVYLLGRRAAGGPLGALVGATYFLFLPLGIYASRSFQIDSTMVVFFSGALLALLKWSGQRSWAWAVVLGVVAGLGVLFKGYGAVILGPAMAAGVWTAAGREAGNWLQEARRIVRDRQVWLILVLTLGPALLYYPALTGETGSLFTRSIFNRVDEVLAPSFYIRWLILLDRLLGLPVILAAFGSAWLAPKNMRGMLLGLWVGYGLHGLAFPKLIITHDYYQLPLVVCVAVSLAPAADQVARALYRRGRMAQLVYALLLLLSAAYPAWIARSVLVAEDFRSAGVYWREVGEAIPTDGRAVGYTQDYGFRLMYYGWRAIGVLPEQISADQFLRQYPGADYFVITARNQMSADLGVYLEANYPVLASGGGYVIYDLTP